MYGLISVERSYEEALEGQKEPISLQCDKCENGFKTEQSLHGQKAWKNGKNNASTQTRSFLTGILKTSKILNS